MINTLVGMSVDVRTRRPRIGNVTGGLSGPAIRHRQGGDIISDGTVPGAVQVPGSGQPTVLAADSQTVGGYVKVATVISSDMPFVARLQPGSQVRFASVSLVEAREVYLEHEFMLRRWYERQ